MYPPVRFVKGVLLLILNFSGLVNGYDCGNRMKGALRVSLH